MRHGDRAGEAYSKITNSRLCERLGWHPFKLHLSGQPDDGSAPVSLARGDEGKEYWARRYQTIFDRFESIGLAFVGPQFPGGRQASPWPDELPPTSKNVPTRHTPRQGPAGATRQLDFVFASHGLAPQIQVRALNELDAWGPSDHCRVEIVVG